MTPFLKILSDEIYQQHPRLEKVTIVFPNRRAALYFRKYLSESLNKPAFAPALLTIEDFISQLSPLKVPDKLELVSRLQKSYHAVIKNEADAKAEPFDKFYFWGDMLLRDFDEADRYLVNTEHLFKDLSHQKELDSSFDFLTKEQKEFLTNFWSSFAENESNNKRKFLHVWKKLPEVYKQFQQQLRSANLAYEGMLHRDVAERISSTDPGIQDEKYKNLIFVGFNALTACEEKIVSYFIEHLDAKMHWDIDEYYVNNQVQEAGRFFREYQKHPVLKKTFSSDLPSNLSQKKLFVDNPKLQF
jgi:hypothetical protein